MRVIEMTRLPFSHIFFFFFFRTEGDKATVKVFEYKDQQSIVSDGGRSAKGTTSVVVNLKEYPHKVLPLQNVDGNGNLCLYSDMISLSYLHEVRLDRVLLSLSP